MASSYDSLDFAPLTEPVSSADIQAFKASDTGAQKSTVSKLTTGMMVVVILLFAGCSILLFRAVASSGFGLIPGGIAAVFFILVGGVIIASMYANQKKLARLYKFATRNQLVFSQNVPSPGYPGVIFGEGHSRTLKESLIFPASSVEIGNYEYTTGSGKDRQTHDWGYVRIKLARRLPNMVLDAKSNNFFGVMSNLPDSFSKGQKLELEGDFNNYFTLYAPAEYKTDALYVFTPDVMMAVIDSGKSYDMEVIDDNLMIYSSREFLLTSPDELKSLLAIAEKIGDEIREQSSYYADERVASRSENIVAEPGRRLKTGVSRLLIVVIILLFLYNLVPIIRMIIGG